MVVYKNRYSILAGILAVMLILSSQQAIFPGSDINLEMKKTFVFRFSIRNLHQLIRFVLIKKIRRRMLKSVNN